MADEKNVAEQEIENLRGQPDGLASLDGAGKIPDSQLSATVINDTFVVSSEIEQLALTVQKGDIAVRTDESKSYVNSTGLNTSMADWTQLLQPPDAVTSVDGKTGSVDLSGDYEPLDATIMKEGEDVSKLNNDSDYQSGSEVDSKITTHKSDSDAHHSKYTDGEAVTAMSPKADNNPLNHDRPVQATESIVGIAEIATQVEADAGTDDEKIITPKKLAAYPFPGSSDEKVKSDSADPTAGFLDGKVDNVGVAVDSTNHKLILKSVFARQCYHIDSLRGEAGTFDGQTYAASSFGVYLDWWYLCTFDDGAPSPRNAAATTIHLPSDYKEGSDIIICLTWVPNSANTGNVKWQIGTVVASVGDVLDPTSNTPTYDSAISPAPGVSVQKVSTQITVDGTNLSPGDSIALVIFRDSGDVDDTLVSDAWLVDFGLRYETNAARGGVIP